jgi:MiaB/RimO family radical SAM methylthiotransferase
MVNDLMTYTGQLWILGCIPGSTKETLLKKLGGIKIATKDIHTIDDYFPNFVDKFVEIPEPESFRETNCSVKKSKRVPFLGKLDKVREFHIPKFLHIIRKKHMTSACIKISDGCPGNCTYCVIRFAVGRLRSKSLNKCVEEYKRLLEKGYRQFTMQAEDCGAYGQDIGRSFCDLLSGLSTVGKGISVKWDIDSINPQNAIKFKDELMVWVKCKIESIDIPVQSGSIEILRMMNRYNKVNNIIQLLQEFRKQNSDIYITSHFIVGFPGETENDFDMTLDLIHQTTLDQILLFKYSDMEKAPSFKLPNKITNAAMNSRLNRAKLILGKEYVYRCETGGITFVRKK